MLRTVMATACWPCRTGTTNAVLMAATATCSNRSRPSRADDPDRPTIEEADADAEQLIGAAPRLFPYSTGSYSCSFFPESIDPRIEITGIGAGPIVVVGTTGDPSTPLDSSRKMAAALEDGRLVVVVANQHTGYGVNDCIDDVIHDYLVQLEAPENETICD